MASTPQLEESTIEALADELRGALLSPGDEGYGDALAIWNGMIDRTPPLVAQCQGTADVMAAVEFVRSQELTVSVKGGGHNVAGRAVAEDGLMLDMSGMDGVRVDPGERVATVEPGCRWGDVDHETQAFGLATTGGVDSRTGVAGLTLGGGWGWLARKHGMAVDNLRGVDLVTADGEFVRADPETNPELFWGIRGGGGNFGVVTAFEYDLHPVGPAVMTAQVMYETADLAGALGHFQSFMADAPDEVGAAAILLTIPPMEPFPEDHHGTTAVSLAAMHCGGLEEGESVLREFADYGDPIFELIDALPYTVFQRSFDDVSPAGERYYYKTEFVEDLPPEGIDTLVEHCDPLPAPFTLVSLEAMGGAINRRPADATAFPHRNADHDLGIYGGWSDPDRDDEIREWVRGVHDAMQPYTTGGAYANYLDQDDAHRSDGAFGENLSRLAELKREWDSENLFAHNVPIDASG